MSPNVVCPGCRREVAHVARCPHCDYPLVLVAQAAQAPVAPHAPARRPGERPGGGPAEPTEVLPPMTVEARALPPRPEPGIVCPSPSCRQSNPMSRTLCQVCGTPLRPERQPTAPLPVTPPPPPPRRNRKPALITGAVAVLAAVGIGSWSLTSLLRGHHDVPKPKPVTSSARPAAAVAVPADQISAAASSVLKRDGTITYVPQNLLDGDPTTAWNSNGSLAKLKGKVTLTFTFAKPYDLRSVTVLSGYQKLRPGKKPADLFLANARPAQVEVRTDANKATWQLQDVKTAQTLTAPFGRTTSVTLVIRSTYAGENYVDVALSEVSFTGVPWG